MLPDEPPPVRPLPATTSVMSPPELVSVSMSFAQAQFAPFHLSTWPAPQVFVSDSVTLPVEPPPMRPPAVPIEMPVIVPPELVSVSMSFAQPHTEPFHLSSWPLPHVPGSDSATAPLVPPPTSPPGVPTVTAVISPESLSVPHAHVVPVDLSTWPGLHVMSDSVAAPVFAPPARPGPAITAVMSPVPAVSGAQLTLPSALMPCRYWPVLHVPVIFCCRPV